MKRCLHQILRPKRKSLSRPHNVGECITCEYDPEENKKCSQYTPITLEEFQVEDGDNDERS